jgi:hypothetical protein
MGQSDVRYAGLWPRLTSPFSFPIRPGWIPHFHSVSAMLREPLLHFVEIPNDASRAQRETFRKFTAPFHLKDGAIRQGYHPSQLLASDSSHDFILICLNHISSHVDHHKS